MYIYTILIKSIHSPIETHTPLILKLSSVICQWPTQINLKFLLIIDFITYLCTQVAKA